MTVVGQFMCLQWWLQGLSRSCLRVTRLVNVLNIPCWILIKQTSGMPYLCTMWSTTLCLVTLYCLHFSGLKEFRFDMRFVASDTTKVIDGHLSDATLFYITKGVFCALYLHMFFNSRECLFDHFRHWQCCFSPACLIAMIFMFNRLT